MATTLEDYVDNKSHEIISPFPRKTIQVYFDGLCQPCNPGGTACFAFIAKNEGNTLYNEYGLAAHKSTNNVAEYTGIIRAIEWLIANNYQNESIVIKGDSQLVINQVLRKFKVKEPRIIPLYFNVMSLISNFDNIQFEWIPREQNKEADRLCNSAYISQQITAKHMPTEQ
jgi:ribonuclease HI